MVYQLVLRMKNILPGEAQSMVESTRAIGDNGIFYNQLRFDFNNKGCPVLLSESPLGYYFGSPNRKLGDSVGVDELLSHESPKPEGLKGLVGGLLEKMFHNSYWVGIYKDVSKPLQNSY